MTVYSAFPILHASLETSSTPAFTRDSIRHIIFIDASVQDYTQLGHPVLPNADLILLDETQNGLEQITDTLANYAALESIHIVSHGAPAQLQLGASWLTTETLMDQARFLQQWRRSLTPTANLLLYGCEVGATETGVAFVQTLSQLTGAAVAASDNLTGCHDLGGDWELAVTTGDITACLAFPQDTLAAYPHVLNVIRINDVSLDEGTSGETPKLVFTVSLDAPAAGTVTVDYATGDGSATAGSDFVAATDTITFNEGEQTKTVEISLTGDAQFESDELFSVFLSNATNATIADNRGVGIILNDDAPPQVSISDAVAISEGANGAVATFTVTLTGEITQPVIVNYGTVDGTAVTTSGDYTNTSGILVFQPGGAATQTITVPINDDSLNEANETFSVKLTQVYGANIAKSEGQAQITNDDPLPSLSIGDVTVDEANGTATFTVSLSAKSGRAVTVDYSTEDDTASAGTDYTLTQGTLTLAAGETSKTFTVPIADDSQYESAEAFFVKLSNPTNATINDGQAKGTIQNDDPLPVVSIANLQIDESNGSTIATVTLTLTGTTTTPVTVTYATADGTATEADGDYVAETGTVNFAAGETTKTIQIVINGDTTFEANETFTVDLSQPQGATLGNSTAQVTIRNDDGVPALQISNATVVEGDSGTQNLVFTVTLTTPTSQTVTVDYATAAGTATEGDDFTAKTGTLTFQPNQTSQTIVVPIKGDTIDEGNETITVTLSNPLNSTIEVSQGTGTITDNDGVPTISIEATEVIEGDDSTELVFSVRLSNPTGQTVTVDYETLDGTATTANNDYDSKSGQITFNPGDELQTIRITVQGDTRTEPDETITVKLTNPTNATLGSAEAIGTIQNDDSLPGLVIDNVSIEEGNSGKQEAIFIVSLNKASDETVTVQFETVENTATEADNDYDPQSGTLTFEAGETEKTITISVNGDETIELNESFYVKLKNASANATLNDDQGVATIRNDDQLPEVSIGNVEVVEGNNGTKLAIFTVSLSKRSTQSVRVQYTTLDDTALVTDGDYINVSGELSFAPDTDEQTISVVINGDTKAESNETFVLRLRNAVGATIGTSDGIATITNDDLVVPKLSIQDVKVTEGNSGLVNLTFTVTLDTPSGQPITVNYATADGTATVADQDYVATTGTITFAPNEISKTITVAIKGDLTTEPDETFFVNLTNPTNATIASGQATVTLANNDGIPTLSVDDITVREGNSGTTNATFVLSLSGPSSETIRVTYATAEDTATIADRDFQAIGPTEVIFRPGETSKTVTVAVNGDTQVEPDETFSLVFSNQVNALLASAIAKATITNDDRVVGTNNGATVIPATPDPDTLTGSDLSDLIDGLEGNDLLEGNAGNDLLYGGEGDDVLNGGEGNDFLDGGAGNDVLYGSTGRDALLGKAGADVLYGGDGDDAIFGSAGNDRLFGEAGQDILYGRDGNDRLFGGADNDTLVGNFGKDQLAGGSGKDQFMFRSKRDGVDRILDFSVKDDRIAVSRQGFKAGLKAGAVIDQSEFRLGSRADDGSDRFIYNQRTGALFFDADGDGGANQIQLAKLSKGLNLTHRSIEVVA